MVFSPCAMEIGVSRSPHRASEGIPKGRECVARSPKAFASPSFPFGVRFARGDETSCGLSGSVKSFLQFLNCKYIHGRSEPLPYGYSRGSAKSLRASVNLSHGSASKSLRGSGKVFNTPLSTLVSHSFYKCSFSTRLSTRC